MKWKCHDFDTTSCTENCHLTTFGAASGENFVKITKFPFQWRKIAQNHAHILWDIVYLHKFHAYRQTSNISCTLVGNKIDDHSDDVVGASPVGAAPTTPSFLT